MAAFCIVMVSLFFNEIPSSNKETLTYAMGQLSGMVTTALAFYFSTTKSSAEKNDIIGQLSDVTTPQPVKIEQPAGKPVPVEPVDEPAADQTRIPRPGDL